MSKPEYDSSDGWNEDRGCEQCPRCEVLYSANGGYVGPVYDMDGNRYDTLIDTDPGGGPYPCEECWQDIETELKRAENETLDNYG